MTGNKEDYLKIIYELGGDKGEVSNKDIAKALGISAPSVSEMIKKLLKEGYVEYEAYKGIKLTEYGLKEAKRVRRRHLLWEVFLEEKLGYSWDEVHEEAEKLEHVTSEKLERLLDKYLGYPNVCPHGTDIPKEGEENKSYKRLIDLALGEEVVLKSFFDHKEILNYVNKKELRVGDKIKVVEKDKDNKLIVIKKGNKDIFIEKEYSKKIFIE